MALDPVTDKPAAPDGGEPEQVLRSPALYLGEVRLPPDSAGSARGLLRLSGRSLKNLLFPPLHWLFRRAPRALAMLPLQLTAALSGLAYGLQRNALRQACEDVAGIAREHGVAAPAPKEIYRRFMHNALVVATGYFDLERRGVDAALERVEISDDDGARMRSMLEAHEGIILAVGHNLAAVFCAAKLSRTFRLLIVSKNSSTADRTRMALSIFERMGAKVLMVRGGRPTVLARAMIKALRERHALVSTVDNVERDEAVPRARIFGQEVGFSPWAANIAAKRRVPVVPAWFAVTESGRIKARFGEPLQSTDPAVLIQHYVSYFERCILNDPANWAYLADRKWRQVLAAARQTGASKQGARCDLIRPMNIVIFGPPGAGKGTQAARIKERHGMLHISTGDMFRDHCARDTEIGLRVKDIMAKGQLVPDAITDEMVRERLGRDDAASGVLLDGYPRNVAQAAVLLGLCRDLGRPLDGVLVIDVPDDELRVRLRTRAEQQGRTDDADPAVIDSRITTYKDQSEPCIEYFREQGITVHVIDGVGEIDDITQRINTALAG